MAGRRRVFILPVAILLPACGAEPSLLLAARVHHSEQALRPDHPASTDMFRFDGGDVVEPFDSPGGSFRLHFARLGTNAVPAADADTSGIPDFIEQAALVYDEVLGFYRDSLGFRAPLSDAAIADNGGDGRFDVYFVDFAGNADGAFRIDGCLTTSPERCIGYMVQENDFAGYGYPSTAIGNRILASHEFFHAVQDAYDDAQGSILGEGTATWATETFDPSLDDFEGFIAGYLDNPDRSLDKPMPGPVDPFSYGSGIFWQFLSERFGQGTIRTLWESVENGARGVPNPDWFAELGGILTESAATGFADAFFEFAQWNLYTGGRADPTRSYAAGAGYPRVKLRAVAAPYFDSGPRYFYASTTYYALGGDGRSTMTAALVGPDLELAELRVFLVVDRGGYGDPVELLDLRAGSESVDTSGTGKLVVAVVNTGMGGPSRRPAICIGSPEEVAGCKTALNPPPVEPPPEESGCAAVNRDARPTLALVGLATLLGLGGRHRRRPR